MFLKIYKAYLTVIKRHKQSKIQSSSKHQLKKLKYSDTPPSPPTMIYVGMLLTYPPESELPIFSYGFINQLT